MKNILPLLSLLLLFNYTSIIAQDIVGQKPERNVPIAVSSAFKDKFPSMDPIWFSNYQGRYNQKMVYEGRFIFDNRYSTAVYDPTGKFIAFAAKVETNEVPQKVMEYMKENFPSFPIKESILVTYGDEVTYELGIFIDGQYVIKVFSKTGEFIKSTRA